MIDDEFYMMKAIIAAKKNLSNNEYPFGCCIVYKDEIIIDTNTGFSERNPLRHAELNAINRFIDMIGIEQLKESVIYTTTEPCLMCLGAINWVHIPKLVYGTSVRDSNDLGFKEVDISTEVLKGKFPYEIEVKSGILKDECMELLNMWKVKNKFFKLFNKVHAKCDQCK